MKKQRNIQFLIRITTTIIVVVMFIFFISCKDKNENLVEFSYDPEKIPTVITDSGTTLISDSGITRYKIETEKWLMFERAKEPYWFFPNGIYVEGFDLDMNVDFTVRADSAWFYKNERLWKLNGKVHIENRIGEQFDSEEFFWNQNKRIVYSDKYIEIIRRDLMLIKAVGFRSNQEMTDWEFLNLFDSRIPFSDEPKFEDPLDSLQLMEQEAII